ncbi:MAG: DUF975 family protein [Prevotellaceae bacterium]|nr:DUF975 family protein [Prevotellaceae bacterium]
MQSISTYKNLALASLKGKWEDPVITTLVYAAIVMVLGQAMTLPFALMGTDNGAVSIVSLLLLPLQWGFYVYFLNFKRGQYALKNIFDGYTSQNFVRTLLTLILYTIIILIGLILLIVPGIILMLMYSQTYFLMKDEPELKNMAALRKSADMMKGHKMQLFKLCFSFIGWIILALCTFGIGFLWLEPYMFTTLAHYYEDLKAEYAARDNYVTSEYAKAE